MANSREQASEDFIRMIQILADDEELTKWFLSLHPLAGNLRYSTLGAMVEHMKADHEDPEVIAAIQSLMDPAVYDAAYKTILNITK